MQIEREAEQASMAAMEMFFDLLDEFRAAGHAVEQGPDLGSAAATHDNRFGAAVKAGSVHAADRGDPAH
ncbi:hypothetical protein [Streptomyces collinus]|uniref:hypothetical protein n=1 Tax=Streptomyces collinus TaxID=42684 RepID=UPI00381EA83B